MQIKVKKDVLAELLSITEKMTHLKDIDSLLNNILFEARKFTNADAGSIFLKTDTNELVFSYVQNDTIAKVDESSNKYIYSNHTLPINEKSIAGHVALRGNPLLIDDVYLIDPAVPYSFNKSFDIISKYRTKSALTVPLVTSRDQVIGVMQIINSKDESGNIVPFSKQDQMYVTFFANNASVAIERAKMTREIILRMIKMAELRDPKETGAHVNRVASYSIEIYERWANKKKYPIEEIKKFKDLLRIAAMLHDVGKVAISDTILKKPAKLDENEFCVMKTHCNQGAKLFDSAVSALDLLSADIALTHHEKWDGSGYPRGLKNEEISIAGRITALADVFDALVSKRVYKDAWDEQDVLNYLKSQSGSHFDPEVVEAFESIYDIIQAIRGKFPDKD